MSLDKIGLDHGTDKSSAHHDYLRVYEREIPAARRGALLELGWLDGASVRTWRAWLPGWTIVGLDIEPKEPVVGVEFVLGPQDDPDVIERAAAFGPFDAIIDDASHEAGPTRRSFERLWPHVRPGGRYFVEDIHTSYLPRWGGSPDPEAPETAMALFKRLADAAHHGHMGVLLPGYHDVARVAFWPGLAMAEKRA